MARRSGGGMTVDTDKFISDLKKSTKIMMANLLIVSQRVALQMELWAKENARWTDRTGDARAGLTGEAKWIDSSKISTIVRHSVDYGKWLEFAHERNYAILDEAINSQKGYLISEYKRVAGRDFGKYMG